MKKLRKLLLLLLVVVVLLFAGTLLSMRILRHKTTVADEVSPGIKHVRNLFTEIYGARAGDRVMIFDAGVDERGDALDALLAGLGAKRDDVTDIFLSHGHFDHVAASSLCKKARIHIGVQDTDLLAHKVRAEPGPARWLSKVFSVPPASATDALLDRSEILLGGETLTAIPLPGHTPGSYGFVFRGVLFAGDSIQISGGKLQFCKSSFSVDPELNHKSLAGIKKSLGTVKVEKVCTGHQGCTEGDASALLDDLIKRASP